MFAFVYPGSETVVYPLMDAISAFFGGGLALPVLCGVVSTLLVGFFGVRLFRSRFAGLSAAALFALSPSVLDAASHLEASLFDLTLVLVALFLAWCATVRLASRVWKTLVALLFVAAAVVGITWARPADGLGDLLFALGFVRGVRRLPRFILFAFATLPFLAVLLATRRTRGRRENPSRRFFGAGMAVVAILAVATPLAPSRAMEPYGLFPVASCALVALFAGALLAALWRDRVRFGARLVFYILAFVLGFSSLFALFTHDFRRGAFADLLAEKILADLDGRAWLVTEGSLDRNLKALAEAQGRELHLVRLDRDDDPVYRARLAAEFRAAAPAGSASDSLARSLDIGILAFVEDWLKADPDCARKVALFGAPDLWYASGKSAVAEFAIFGGDPARPYDAAAWSDFSKILYAPRNWGSYSLYLERNPVDRLRLMLRRHLGLCANNRAVRLLEEGGDAEAFELLERVFTEIDRDNVSALANLLVLVARKHPAALVRKEAYDAALKRIVADKDRRYQLWRLSNFYGYIADPALFLRLGFDWARSGRPGIAAANIRRAIDYVPTDRRASLMNMLASCYAVEGDRREARRLYTERLAARPDDHDALVGLCGTFLMEGDVAQASTLLERAVKVAGDDPRVTIERAMLLYLKDDFAGAEKLLEDAAVAAKDNVAYALLANVMVQRADAERDAAKKAAIEKDLAGRILPAMEARAGADDFHFLSTRGFVAMRRGPESFEEARRDLARAMEVNPAAVSVREAVLRLDMALVDTEGARRHARVALRTDRTDPLAHYILGSLAFQQGDLAGAEPYLKFAADAKRPVLFAVNDLAELYRRRGDFAAAETYARRAVAEASGFPTALDTLACVLLDRGGDLAEAEELARRAVENSRKVDGKGEVHYFLTLARIQAAKGERDLAAITLRQVIARERELSDDDRADYGELRKKL